MSPNSDSAWLLLTPSAASTAAAGASARRAGGARATAGMACPRGAFWFGRQWAASLEETGGRGSTIRIRTYSTAIGKFSTRGCGELGITGSDDAAVRAQIEGAALPVGDDAAGALDHRHQRAVIVGLEPGLDDEVDEPARQLRVGIAIGAAAAELHRAAQPREAIGLVAAKHRVRRRAKQRGRRERGARPRAHRRAVERGSAADRAQPALAQDRLGDDAGHRPAATGQGDERAHTPDAPVSQFAATT